MAVRQYLQLLNINDPVHKGKIFYPPTSLTNPNHTALETWLTFISSFKIEYTVTPLTVVTVTAGSSYCSSLISCPLSSLPSGPDEFVWHTLLFCMTLSKSQVFHIFRTTGPKEACSSTLYRSWITSLIFSTAKSAPNQTPLPRTGTQSLKHQAQHSSLHFYSKC